jgi:dolichyl-phosphate-mannose--protein O-mannosyl transferase
MKELPITLLIRPTGFDTLSTRIWSDTESAFLVGAGVVWISMRIGEVHPPWATVLIIGTVLAINGGLVHGYQWIFKRSTGRVEQALVRYFGVAMRFNALLIGALSVQMILGGITEFLAEQ